MKKPTPQSVHPVSAVFTSTCPYCAATYETLDTEGLIASLAIDPKLPQHTSGAHLCPKCFDPTSSAQTKGRLSYPEVLGQQVSWELALCSVAGRLQSLIEQYGPSSIAFYTSGQLMTEDYYVANKLLKGFIGSANIESNSSLYQHHSKDASSIASWPSFNQCTYNDIDQAELIVLTKNTMAMRPDICQRVLRARVNNPSLYVVEISSLRSPSSGIADLDLTINTDTELNLFNGLIAYLERRGLCSIPAENTAGKIASTVIQNAIVMASDTQQVADTCGLDASVLKLFYNKFSGTKKAITIYSHLPTRMPKTTEQVTVIVHCHLLSGKNNRIGSGTFSITDQSNVNGCKEAGARPGILPKNMQIGNPLHHETVKQFWQSSVLPKNPGYNSSDLFTAITRGQIKALWIMSCDPISSFSESSKIADALRRCEFVVVSSSVADSNSVKYADIRLPTVTRGEREGTVIKPDNTLFHQRQFLNTPGLAKPDWWIIKEVAALMGWQSSFNYRAVSEVSQELAALPIYKTSSEQQPNVATKNFSSLGFNNYPDNEPENITVDPINSYTTVRDPSPQTQP